MRPLLMSLFMIVSFESVFCQTKAITEIGDEVVLYEDGTWKYISAPIETEILVNPLEFNKPESSTFLVKSKIAKFGVWISPKVWPFTKSEEGESTEYEFQMRKQDLFAMAVVEDVEMPLKTLRTVAIENAMSAAPDLVVVNEEYRKVNNIRLLHMEMDGSIQGIKFKYYGYYYSGEEGTIQLIAYSYGKTAEKYITIMEELINGLTIL